jgi:hypothetical protein
LPKSELPVNAPGKSSVHVPDLPVISGTFTGRVDLSLAVLHRVPLGSIVGSFTITQIADGATGTLVPLPQPVVLPFKARLMRSDRRGRRSTWATISAP